MARHSPFCIIARPDETVAPANHRDNPQNVFRPLQMSPGTDDRPSGEEESSPSVPLRERPRPQIRHEPQDSYTQNTASLSRTRVHAINPSQEGEARSAPGAVQGFRKHPRPSHQGLMGPQNHE